MLRCHATRLLAAAVLVAFPIVGHAETRTLEVTRPAGATPPRIESFKVGVTILPGFSLTRVDQVYRNTEARELEARYRFPIPWRAAVSDFSMWVNGKEVRGEVVRRKKARRIYESIVNRKRDPGLLEMQSHRYFSLRVYPVPPKGEVRFQISYVQPLDQDAGFTTYVFPLATNARAAELRASQFGVRVDLAPGAPIVEAYSTSHSKETVGVRYGKSVYRFSLETQNAALDRDFVLTYRLDRAQTGVAALASRRDDRPGYFFLALTPGEELTGEPRPTNYIFLLDTSGSMRHRNLLPAGREALNWFLDRMSPESRFGLIGFNVVPKLFGKGLHTPDEKTRAAAMQWMEARQARGGTDFLPALREALALAKTADPDRETAIVVISDGRVTGGEARVDRYTDLVDGGRVRVFALGIGNDVNRPLLEALAGRTGGFARYVSSAGDLRAALLSLKTKIVSPSVTDLRVRFEGGGVTQLVPGKLPPVFAGSQLVIAGRYSEPGKVGVVIEGRSDGKAVRLKKPIDLPARSADNPELERGWAAFHVRELLAHGGRGATEKVTQLGLEYGLVTPFTSYLVLESEAEYARHGIGDTTRKRVEIERDAQSRRATRLEQQRQAGGAEELAMGQQPPEGRVTPRGGGGGSLFGGGGGSLSLLFLLAAAAATLLAGRRGR